MVLCGFRRMVKDYVKRSYGLGVGGIRVAQFNSYLNITLCILNVMHLVDPECAIK